MYNCTRGIDMKIILDTSTIIAVITNEASKAKIISVTLDAELISPESVHWEIGSAFSAMFKRQMVTLEQAQSALKIYEKIPIRFVNIDLGISLSIASANKIYAYDAYLISCAIENKSPLLTLDKHLADVSEQNGVEVLRID